MFTGVVGVSAVRSMSDGGGGYGAPGQASVLRFDGRRVRRLPCGAQACGPVAKTPYAHFVRCGQTLATSQLTKRAARAGHKPSAPRRLRGAPPPARARLRWSSGGSRPDNHRWIHRDRARRLSCGGSSPQTPADGSARQGVPGGGDFCGDGGALVRGRRACALRELTRRGCSNAANEVSVVSSAARPRACAPACSRRTRRPPQHEPAPGTPCCATL
ncbi:hypothetical protein BH11PSE8_BH11PSE8_07740 [soil metagenome]